uniref:Leucine-rich repeat-containing protein 30-like n=1 Tax=Scleropages formosus TaxID=113540 RepID=A0A8C9RQ46_SCLFO
MVTVLEVLSLAGNQITGLPTSLAGLVSLKKLNLSHNLIFHIPGCIYRMRSLVFLQLACNQLENIADQIQALVNLRILILEGNCIHTLPRALCFLTSLELLNVDFNDIQDVPTEMHLLTKLERVACHPLDKGLHILHNPLLKPIREILDGGLGALYNYLKSA